VDIGPGVPNVRFEVSERSERATHTQERPMTTDGARRYGHPTRCAAAALALAALCAAVAVTAALAAAEPVVHVYDVEVTGALRTTFSLPAKPLPLDIGWSETARWTETYKGVRLEVRTPEDAAPWIEMGMLGKGRVTGSVKYGLTSRHKSCGLSTNRPEAGLVRLLGTPYASSAPGARRYRLFLATGRSATTPPLRSSTCTYFQGGWAKFTGVRVGPGGGTATGYIDARKVSFEVEFRTPQQPGQLGFPLSRLNAGAGFALDLRGKTREQSGRLVSEGTARITFVPRRS
jgi:hypothetical protein